ncbi:MAG: uroporphyrinogen decarboxylase family protein, partial [Planctomycetota bacterium]
MNRRARLMATLRGEPVDRPPVSFYELGGLDEDPLNTDPFNVYNDPSWAPLIALTREKTDRIVMRSVPFRNAPPDPVRELTTVETHYEGSSRITTRTVRAAGRTLLERTRRDPDVNTVWTTEHLLKDADDLRAWIDLPEAEPGGEPDASRVLAAEEKLGDAGIVMIDVGDPLCAVASLFDLGEYTIIAMTEQKLFRQALEKVARRLYPRVEAIAAALPGRLWRVVGPEYASPPYLPPRLFEEYVTRYDKPIVDAIQRHGGFARVHSHGRLKDILDHIAATGCVGLDPVEPPPQGDVSLRYVRERYGRQMVLFGNIEVSDIENLPTSEFERKVE